MVFCVCRKRRLLSWPAPESLPINWGGGGFEWGIPTSAKLGIHQVTPVTRAGVQNSALRVTAVALFQHEQFSI